MCRNILNKRCVNYNSGSNPVFTYNVFVTLVLVLDKISSSIKFAEKFEITDVLVTIHIAF